MPVNLIEIKSLLIDKIRETFLYLSECFILVKMLSQEIFPSQPHIFNWVLFGSVRCK